MPLKGIEQMYALYKQDIYAYLLGLTRNPQQAEDLLSETFISAIRSIHRFEGQSSLKTWLCSIARHKWLDYLRKQKRMQTTDSLLQHYVAGDAHASAEHQYLSREAAERTEQLLASKDERTQQIVRMRIAGYCYSEIAETCRLSESSARVIDFRIKKWLKETLVKEGLR